MLKFCSSKKISLSQGVWKYQISFFSKKKDEISDDIFKKTQETQIISDADPKELSGQNPIHHKNNDSLLTMNNEIIQTNESELKDPLFPSFKKLDQMHLKAHTPYSIENQLYSPFRWTPLIQKTKTSDKFHEEMYRLSKVRKWNEDYAKELVDACLFEALRNTNYDYYYDYKCLPSKSSQFHGVADFMIYKKSGSHLPFVPILMVKKKYHHIIGDKIEMFDISPIVGAGIWSFYNMKAIDKDVQFARAIQTTGHKWQMCEVGNEANFRKTGIYSSNTPENFKKIFFDPKFQEVVLGLIRFACSYQSENESNLRKAYDFIDERRYLTELDQETKQKLEQRKRFWSFLPEKLREFFFQ